MRTTVDIDTPVLERLRRLAERRGVSLGRLASDLLARSLKDQQLGDEPVAGRFRWKAVAMGRPRVPLEDKNRLYEVLDGGTVAAEGPRARRKG